MKESAREFFNTVTNERHAPRGSELELAEILKVHENLLSTDAEYRLLFNRYSSVRAPLDKVCNRLQDKLETDSQLAGLARIFTFLPIAGIGSRVMVHYQKKLGAFYPDHMIND